MLPPGRTAVPGLPDGSAPADGLGDAARSADEIVASAEARAAEIVRAAEEQAAGIDRWDGLGEHVARIVAQAEDASNAAAIALFAATAGRNS